MRARSEAPSQAEILLAPGARIRLLSRRIGEDAVAAWCAELLSGEVVANDRDHPSLKWLGGQSAASGQGRDYWSRVWGARGLLYAWTPSAEPAVLGGLHDPAWRVREMCAKVVRRRELRRAEPVLAHLLDDPVPRVRAAAESALTVSARSRV